MKVPVQTHPLADPAKGTGIAMVCTFGGHRRRDLVAGAGPGHPPAARAGRPPAGVRAAGDHQGQAGRSTYRQLAGATLGEARSRITALARAAGELIGEPEPVVHPVKFYEKGDTPLEIITTRQWYLRSGGRDRGCGTRCWPGAGRSPGTRRTCRRASSTG